VQAVHCLFGYPKASHKQIIAIPEDSTDASTDIVFVPFHFFV